MATRQSQDDSYVLTLTGPIFEIGAKPGDDVVVSPGHEQPVHIVRAVRPEYGALAAALSQGRAVCANLSTDEALGILVALAGEMPAPAQRRCRRGTGKWKPLALVPGGGAA